jgi:hypothetical protein
MKHDLIYKPILMDGKPAQLIVTAQSSDMPGALDIENNPILLHLYNRAFRMGKAEGKAEILMRQMRHRYGALPEPVVATVLAAQPAELDAWADAIFEADSLENLLTRQPEA